MKINRRAALCSVATLAIAGRTHAAQDAWPDKPIRIVVPFAAGGTADVLARALAPELQRALGQTVTVDNKPGEGGNLGAAEVAKSAADGSTFLMGSVGTHAINAALYPSLPYDPVKDFAPVTLVAGVPNVVVMNNVSADTYEIKTLADVIRASRANPGKMNMASSGNGSSVHLAGELFKAMSGSFLLHFPFRGSAAALAELMSGKMDIMFDSLPSSLPHIRAGKLRALGITSSSRSRALPDLGTIAESGVPELKGFEASAWFGMLAPARTSEDIIERMQRAVAFALVSPSVKERLLWQGADLGGGPSAEFGRYIQTETKKWAEIVKRSGARID